jgi:uncharacterized protein YhjY with autotransporter beta-barrel domain
MATAERSWLRGSGRVLGALFIGLTLLLSWAGSAMAQQPPVITSIEGNRGTPSSMFPLYVLIHGTNLEGAEDVTFGGMSTQATAEAGETVIVPYQGSLFVRVPPGGAGVVDVVVITPNGNSAPNAAAKFTYIGPPVITSVDVDPVHFSVEIHGQNLLGLSDVNFGNGPAHSFTANREPENPGTLVRATWSTQSPAPRGTVHVAVITTAGVAYGTGYFPVAPTVSGIAPASGPAAGNTSVLLTGSDFVVGATSVTIGGTVVPAASVNVNNATSLTFMAPAHAAGAVAVTATTSHGTSSTLPGGYTYYAAPSIYESGFPAAGVPGGLVHVNAQVYNDNDSAMTGVTLTATLPNGFTLQGLSPNACGGSYGVSGGVVTVTVGSLPNGFCSIGFELIAGAAGSYAFPMTIGATGPIALSGTNNPVTSIDVAAPAPTVTSASPGLGSTLGGQSVVLTGTNLAGATAVTFGGTPASSFVVDSETQITAVAPARAAGTVNIVVTTPGGASATAAGNQYTFETPPSAPSVTTPSNASRTNDDTPLYSGTAGANLTITVSVDGASIGTTTSGAGGAWSLTQPTALADGVHTVYATASSNNGINSAASSTSSFTVDTAAPSAPTVTAPVTGTVANDNTPTFTGAAEANSTVRVFIGGSFSGNANLVGTNWTYTSTALADATYSFWATATDLTGNLSPQSTTASLTVDTAAPPAPVITSPGDGAVTGVSTTISGTSEPGATIDVSGGTGTTADGAGVWSVTRTLVAGNNYSVSATARDAALNVSGASNTVNFTIGMAPVASSFTYGSVVPYNIGGDPGTLLSVASFVTNSPTSYAVGSATTANGGSVSIDNSGQVGYTPPAGFRGNDSFTYTATNVGGASAPATLTVAVGNPTLAFNLVGSGTRGAALAGVSITTSGGQAPYACATTLASGALPAGTQLNADCTLTGTPSASGTFNFSASVTDSSTGVGPFTQTSGALSLVVAAPTLTMTPAAGALPGATAGVAWSQSVTANGGSAPYSHAITVGALPSGLTLSSAGAVTGTPTAVGTFNFTITATDSSTAGSGGPYAVANSYAVTVAQASQAINFTSTAPSGASVGGATYTPTATSTSGLTISFTIDVSAASVCTLSGGVVSFVGGGACVINANQAGDANHLAAPQVQQGFTVVHAAPVATNRSGVAIAYNSSGTAIDLSGSITGVHSSIAVSTAPAHGTTSVAGDVVTYTPADGYYGADSFSWTATGPGGTSAAATVSLAVATPTAPVASDRTGVIVSYNSGGAAIDLSSSIAGVHSSIAVASAPVHGTTSIAGDVVTYTPAAGYYGADSFTWTATGPGGTSAPATVGLTVATPTAPVTTDRTGVAVAYNSSGTAMDLSGSVTGVHSSIAVASAPAHGTTSIAGDVVTYTPAAGYYGADSFSWTATGPGGTSAPATVSLTVTTPPAPVASNRSGVAVAYNSSGAVLDLSSSITGVHASIAVSTAPAHGATSVAGDVVTYTPADGYYGADSFTYTATGPGGTSAAATVSLMVAAPAAPTAANVSASVAFNSAGQAVALQPAGVHSSLSVAAAPGHGIVSISGVTATYVPAVGYYGADSFTYTATGPGGTSAPATVLLTVATPAAPTVAARSGVAVAYNSPGTSIDLSTSIAGAHTSIAIASAPAQGATSVSGDVVTYVPVAGYFGADSFTYTATGPGGTSAPATVSLSVATPAAPTVVARSGVAVAYNSSGAPIDLSGSVTGAHTSLAVASAPAHGVTSVSGDVVTYVPAAGYFGTDSFTFVATGPGGISAPAAVSLTVAAPAAPTVAARSGVAVAYNSTGTAIDLSASVTGVHASLAVASAPAHGATSISGDVITYVPAAGYFGPDSFAYTATGPGGTSAPAMVSLTVAAPAPPVVAPPTQPVVVPPPPAGGGTAPIMVDLGGLAGGDVDGFRITISALHGTAAIENVTTVSSASAGASRPATAGAFQLVYTPAASFMGTDAVTLVAFGPGGDSSPVTFTFQVAGKAPDLSGQTVSSGSVSFTPTAGLTGGPFEGLRITRAPDFGSAVVQGMTILFTPGAAKGGSTSLDYVIELPFASSATGRISVTSNLAPGVQTLTAGTIQGRPVTVRISDAAGGPFTGAAAVSVSPTDAGAAVITAAGSGAARTYDLTFSPSGSFAGIATVTYTLTNAVGTATSTLAVTVASRPDPGLDPEVRGVATSQINSARRFADAQIGNVQRRLQDLHDGDNRSSNGLSLNLGLVGSSDAELDPAQRLRRELGQNDRPDPGQLGDDRSREMLGLDLWAGRPTSTPLVDATGLNASSASARDPQHGRRDGSVGVWTAGAVQWGRQDSDGTRDARFTTDGVTAGLDVRVSDQLIVGAGLGYGEDKSRIGEHGSVSTGKGATGVLYASWRPAAALYVDGVLGYGDMDFASRRWAAGLLGQPDAYAEGERSGALRFASAAFGRVVKGQGSTSELYARLDARTTELDAFTETGAGLAGLDWDEVTQDSLSASLGAYWGWTIETAHRGQLRPSLRLEWSHEFEDIGDQGVRYADWAASPTYLVLMDAWSRDSLRIDLGTDWALTERMILGIGYRGSFGDAAESHGAEVRLKYGW